MSMTVREAGALGGAIRKKQLGSDGFAELGRKGAARRRKLAQLGREYERLLQAAGEGEQRQNNTDT